MFNFLNKKKEDPVISFVSMYEPLLELPITYPKRMSQEIPSWWKKISRTSESLENIFTVKTCPSFADYFSQGFVIPAWTDVDFNYNVENDIWTVDYPGNINYELYNWGIHSNEQFLKHTDASYYGNKPTMVFKGNSPWRIITKPGWSVMLLPLYYHFDNPLVAMPGIIDTDIIHQLNIQLMYFEDNKKIRIKQGDPLVHVIPFKRSETVKDFDIRSLTEEDSKKITKSDLITDSKFVGSGAYRKTQIDRDRNEEITPG